MKEGEKQTLETLEIIIIEERNERMRKYTEILFSVVLQRKKALTNHDGSVSARPVTVY